MRKTTALAAVLLAVAIGFGIGTVSSPKPVHAQVATFTGCQSSYPSGPSTPCAQYVVQVNSGRGMGRFVVTQVNDVPIDPARLNPIAASSGALSTQQSLPAPLNLQTFTLALSQP